MSDFDPSTIRPIEGFDIPSGTKTWDRMLLFCVCLMAAILVGLGVLLFVVLKQNAGHIADPGTMVQAPAPQAHTTLTYERSTGGIETRKGTADGASISLSGDKVDGKDLKIAPTSISLGDLGSITGGAFEGSFSASAAGMFWIRMLGLLAFLACGALAFLNFKKNPLDWHFTLGLAAGSLGGLVVLVNPEMFYIGLAGLGIAALMNFWPSIMAGKLLEAGKSYEDFVNSDADVKAKWIAYRATTVPQSDKNTIAVIQKANT